MVSYQDEANLKLTVDCITLVIDGDNLNILVN